jgi:CRISPR-associated protein Cas1
MADRFVLTLINNGIVTADDFEPQENGAVLLTKDGRKKVQKEWQAKKQQKITHPFLQEKLEWGMIPYVQALLLARCLRDDLDEYPPFLWK